MKSLPFATQDLQYPFSYLRMGQSGYVAPGVVLSGDMAVSPGTGLQVQIAAGEAYVQQTVARLGSFYASRGVYQIFDDSVDQPYNTITAPVTYPRVDQVIARVYDAYEQQLSGSSFWRYEWLPGVETSGASLTNLNGAATLPDNSLRLAYCLATTSMSSWSSGNILNVAPFSASYPRVVSTSTSTTATSGQCVIVTGSSAVTITLPTNTKNARVKIINESSGGTTVSGSAIYGAGLSNASSFPLGALGAFAELVGDGTSWYIVAGQRDTGWLQLAAGSITYASLTNAFARQIGDRVICSGSIGFTASGSAWSTLAVMPSGIALPPSAVYPIGNTPWYIVAVNGSAGSASTSYIDLQIEPVGGSSPGAFYGYSSGLTWTSATTVSLDQISYRTV